MSTQKPISEKIESRNRIRRLIKHFFTERDCATLVRPIEEETNLQNLQFIPDSELRPEFVEETKKLRNRIFKKVKPKVLNGKFLTGEMLLELIHSYTEAVNKGSVPSIKSAWSYVCMNECQRAIQTALQEYETEMSKFFIQAKEEQNIEVLENGEKLVVFNINRTCLDQVQKLCGDTLFSSADKDSEVNTFEETLRRETTNKYKYMRKEFNYHCERLLEKKYEDRIKTIRRSQILSGSDDNPDNEEGKAVSFKDQITAFKNECERNPPYFETKDNWILEKCLELYSRYAESSTIMEKQESIASLKVLSNRVEELERYSVSVKSEKDEEILLLKGKIEDLQQERMELITKSKLFEEQLSHAKSDKQRVEAKMNDIISELNHEFNRDVEELKRQNDELIEQLRIKEAQLFDEESFDADYGDDGIKQSKTGKNELIKLNALLEQ